MKKNILLIVILGFIVAACTKKSNNNIAMPKFDNEEADIASIIAIIDACPNWIDVSKDDFKTRSKITTIYKSLQKYDNSAIRDALNEIMSAKILTSEAYTSQENRRAKVFALLRLLFEIPQGLLPALPQHNGIGISISEWGHAYHMPYDGTVNLLWPFELRQGNLVLTGVGGRQTLWTGPTYNPIYEFDEMAKVYKRREIK